MFKLLSIAMLLLVCFNGGCLGSEETQSMSPELLQASFELPEGWTFLPENSYVASTGRSTHDGAFSIGLEFLAVWPGTEDEARAFAKKDFERQWEIRQSDAPPPEYIERMIAGEMVYASIDYVPNNLRGAPHWRSIISFEKDGHIAHLIVGERVEYLDDDLGMLIQTLSWKPGRVVNGF